MKRAVYILILILVVAGVIFVSYSKFALFKNGESDYSIVLCNNASISEQTAAKELQSYIEQIGGVTLPIINRNELQEGEPHIAIGYNKHFGEKLGIERPADNDESYTYRSVGKNIWIYGGKQRGTMYGVGCEMVHKQLHQNTGPQRVEIQQFTPQRAAFCTISLR